MNYRTNKKNNKNISINDSIGFDKDGNEITILDILKTPDPDFAMDIHTKNNLKLLKKYFNVLNEREKEIIIKRYGLNDEDEKTQKEIAKELGISRSYVSRIEKRALTKMLKEFIKNKDNEQLTFTSKLTIIQKNKEQEEQITLNYQGGKVVTESFS